jgi:MFS family permease
MTTISAFYASGLILGPIISGLLLPIVGYYATWFIALLVLGFDMMMRLVMIEKKHDEHTNAPERPCNNNGPVETEAENARASSESTSDETSSLIRTSQNDRAKYRSQPDSNSAFPEPGIIIEPPGRQNVYKALLVNPCALTSLACRSAMAVILVSFDTTLPLHSKNEFGWNSTRVSLMFLLLQMPTILLAPLSGLLKDKFGTKFPTAAGFFGVSIFIWLMGTPGEDGLPSAGVGARGQAIFMTGIVGVGCARTLVSGCGTIELTSKSLLPRTPLLLDVLTLQDVMKQLETEQPGRFGPGGGLSTAYSLNNIAWTSGMIIGPLVSGFLVRSFGYYWMNTSLGMFNPTAMLLTIIIANTL